MMSGELFEIDAISLEVSRVLKLEQKMEHKHDHSMHHGTESNSMVHSKVKPTWVIPHPSNKFLYIAGNGSDEIIEVDLKDWVVSDRFKTGKGPYNVEISPNGKFLIATLKGEGSTAIWNLDNKSLMKVIKNTTTVSHGLSLIHI